MSSLPKVLINREGIEQTLSFLKKAGEGLTECVVLWLAERHANTLVVKIIYLPKQIARIDYFCIPHDGISELLKYLRKNKLMVAAQVHTHPQNAFHSKADDEWAIIRHVGGLSLVLPYFANGTTSEDFINDAALFRRSERNIWEEILSDEVESYYGVTS